MGVKLENCCPEERVFADMCRRIRKLRDKNWEKKLSQTNKLKQGSAHSKTQIETIELERKYVEALHTRVAF